MQDSLREENYMFGGLFPEIHRAWITIDKTLYLWNYLDGSQALAQPHQTMKKSKIQQIKHSKKQKTQNIKPLTM